MLYKFKSRATGDLLLPGAPGDELMRLLGRTPSPQGIFEVDDLPELLRRLEAGLAAAPDEAPQGHRASADADDEDEGEAPVGLRQRLWPVAEMMRRSLAASEPIVWGV